MRISKCPSAGCPTWMSPSEPFWAYPFSMGCSVVNVASSSRGTSTTLKSLKLFSYIFPHIEWHDFEMCTSKKPSVMPIVQPHQIKFRVFLLIAQLMVRKLFIGAHFKMPICWLSSLDVSIHQRDCELLLAHDFNVRKNYQKLQMWQKWIVHAILSFPLPFISRSSEQVFPS